MHPFVCLACGKGFKYEHSLNFHIKSYHRPSASSSSSPSTSANAASVPSAVKKSVRRTHPSPMDHSSPSAPVSLSHHSAESRSDGDGDDATHDDLMDDHEEHDSRDNRQHKIKGEHDNHGTSQSSPRDTPDPPHIPPVGSSSTVAADLSLKCGVGDMNGVRGSPPATPETGSSSAGVPFDMGFPASSYLSKNIQIKSEKVMITVLEGVHPTSDQIYLLYKCCLCGFAFPSLEPILSHIQNMHSSHHSNLSCEKCGATFKWRSELQLHESLHRAMDQQGSASSSTASSSASGSTSSPKPPTGSSLPLMPPFINPSLLPLFSPFIPTDADSFNNNNSSTSSGLMANGNTAIIGNKGQLLLNSDHNLNGNQTSMSGVKGAPISSSLAAHTLKSGMKSSSISHVMMNGHQHTAHPHHESQAYGEQVSVLNLSLGIKNSTGGGGENQSSGISLPPKDNSCPSPKRKRSPPELKSPMVDFKSLLKDPHHVFQHHHLIQQQPLPPNPHPSPMGEIEETAPGQFKCRYCDKTFDRIFSVHRHERVHTGYKPCICKVCGRGFSEKRNLRHHIIRFHSDGSGRELLKRARKDKTLAATTKQLAAAVLNNSVLTGLSSNHSSPQRKEESSVHRERVGVDLSQSSSLKGEEDEDDDDYDDDRSFHEDRMDAHDDKREQDADSRNPIEHEARSTSSEKRNIMRIMHDDRNNTSSHAVSSWNGTRDKKGRDDEKHSGTDYSDAIKAEGPSGSNLSYPQASSSSSSRRKKSKPSKKVYVSNCGPMDDSEEDESTLRVVEEEDGDDEDENEDEDEEDRRRSDEPEIITGDDMNPDDDEVNGHISGSDSNSNGGNHSENSLEGMATGKVRNHGAFFSSYSPRLGIVEKPIKRTEVCRPLPGPDGKYIYPCGYCQKTFCSLSDLNRHMNFHEDVRPFKCNYCDYQSRTNSQLKVHMMRHAGIKQYLCQTCNYNGVTQSDLNRHCKTRSHILRSGNVCPLCSLGFSTRTLLEEHLVKFHDTSSSTASVLSLKTNNGTTASPTATSLTA